MKAPSVEYAVLKAKAKVANSSHSRRILIIGGNGFVGRYLVKQLVKKQQENNWIVAVMDIAFPAEGDQISSVEYIRGNVCNVTHTMQAVEGASTVVHMASILPAVGVPEQRYVDINIDGTKNVIKSCEEKNVKTLIYTSSVTVVLGMHDTNIHRADESHPYPKIPLDFYTKTKRVAEELVLAANSTTLATCSLRPGAVYGIGDKVIVDSFFTKPAFVIGDGEAEIDYVDVESVAHAHVCAITKILGPKCLGAGEVYIVGSGYPTKYKTFNGIGTGSDKLSHWGVAHPRHVPTSFIYILALINECCCKLFNYTPFGLELSRIAILYTQRSYNWNIEKIQKHLGYKPVYPTLADSIDAIVKRQQASSMKVSMKHD